MAGSRRRVPGYATYSPGNYPAGGQIHEYVAPAGAAVKSVGNVTVPRGGPVNWRIVWSTEEPNKPPSEILIKAGTASIENPATTMNLLPEKPPKAPVGYPRYRPAIHIWNPNGGGATGTYSWR